MLRFLSIIDIKYYYYIKYYDIKSTVNIKQNFGKTACETEVILKEVRQNFQ